MRPAPASRWLVLFTLAVLIAAERLSARGVGDWVSVALRDGREFSGQVVEETNFKLILNVKQGTIVAKMTIAKSDIRETKLQKSTADVTGADKAAPAKLTTPEEDQESMPAAAPGTGGYIIAPLSGVFGEELTAGFVRAFLQRAVDVKAEAVIFELESPGGMVSELDKIRGVIDEYEPRVKVVFYVKTEAFSAAALLCMSSAHFYVGPGARLGAAVAFHEDSTGSKEVDAKYNSAFAARWRALAEKAGRPGLLVDAMVLLEREVYADTSQTPWKLTAKEPSQGGDDIQQIDDKTSILSLTEGQAVNTGAADGSAPSARALVEKLGLSNPGRRAVDGEAFARAYHKTYERNMVVIRRAVEDYNDTSEVLGDQQNIRKFEQRLREMRGSLQRIIVLYKKYDYVENYFQSRGQSMEDLDRLLRRINDALKQL